MSDLKRLAVLADIIDDKLLKSAFVVGLPRSVSAQLRAIPNVKEMTLEAVVSTARALMSEILREEKARQSESYAELAACGRTAESSSVKRKEELKCFNSGGPHLRKWCTKLACYRCGQVGHMANNCKASRNGYGETYAPSGSH